jgi:Alpha/beta hydrolase domain
MSARVSLARRASSHPSIPGIRMSVITRDRRGSRRIRSRVCAVDADGNELAGVRLPPIAVPLGTYTGWNVYRAQPCELCDRDGSLIPFARTRTEREASSRSRIIAPLCFPLSAFAV